MMKKTKEMNEFDEMKNIRFNITSKMNSLLLELILMEQIMEQKNLTDIQLVMFYRHHKDLKKDFSKEFEKNNKEQIKRYNELVKQTSEK